MATSVIKRASEFDAVNISNCSTYDQIFDMISKRPHTIGQGVCGGQTGTPLATLINDPPGNYSRCSVESYGTNEYKLMKITCTGSFDSVAMFRYVRGISAGDGWSWKKTNWQSLTFQ